MPSATNKITSLIPGGQGIATLESGQKAFFWNALPGEIVTAYEITKKKSKYIEAIATKVENPSPYRIAPKDTCYLSTSPWQIMDYAYELSQKSLLLEESFRQAGLDLQSVAGDTLGPVSISQVQTDNQDFFYRNKMEYSLYYDFSDEKIHLAFHKRGSHAKIKVETSSLERPEIFARAQEIVADLNVNHDEARKYQSLLLRCNQDGVVEGGLFEKGKPHPKFNNLTDQILGHEYSYSPNGFFQINLPVYEMALKEIKSHITTENVLDLYAGVGTIGLSVARNKHLTLVEIDKAAYLELERNVENITIAEDGEAPRSEPARPTGRARATEPRDGGREGSVSQEGTSLSSAARKPAVRTFLSKSEDVLDFIAPDQTVILDPPRAGCDAKLIEKLLETRPTKIIYLSCNPATQARDVKLLEKKYKIVKVQPYNFFPRTPHLENLIILEPK